MKAAKVILLALALSLGLSACGGDKKPKVAIEENKGPGRDQELFRDGVKAINNGRYD